MWLLQEQKRICIIVGQNQHNEVKKMNTYLEALKHLKEEAMQEDIYEILEDLLSIIQEDRGVNYVISLLGDYLESILEG